MSTKLQGDIKVINQRLHTIENNHLAHLREDIKSLNQISEIKGFLIGGASRRPNKFIDIIKKSII